MSIMDEFGKFIAQEVSSAPDKAPSSEPTPPAESSFVEALQHYTESASDSKTTANLIKIIEADAARQVKLIEADAASKEKLMEADAASKEKLIEARSKDRARTIWTVVLACIPIGAVLAYAAYIAVDAFHVHLGLVLSNGWAKTVLAIGASSGTTFVGRKAWIRWITPWRAKAKAAKKTK